MRRYWRDKSNDAKYHVADKFEYWFDGRQELPKPIDIYAKLKELGDEGWELVTVVPASSILGGAEQILGQSSTPGGKVEGYAIDFAGFTTDLRYIFKRPKLSC